MSKRMIRRSSSLKAPKIFVFQLKKKTAIAKYVKKMGFHTDPSKERRASHKPRVVDILKKDAFINALTDAGKRPKGSRLKGIE